MLVSQEGMLCTLVSMDLVIVEEKENPFLKRRELKIELKHPGEATPKKIDLIKELASRYSIEEGQIVVDYIFTKKGLSESFAKVKILKEKPKAKSEEIEAQASKAA